MVVARAAMEAPVKTGRRRTLPRLGGLIVQAYTAILSPQLGRPVSALERKMCFKCKTSKAEVRYCVDWRKLTTLFCTGIKAQGTPVD